MAASTAGQSFVFMNDQTKFDPGNRKLIRKTVMMGKNLGKKRKNKRETTQHHSDRMTKSSNATTKDAIALETDMASCRLTHPLGNDLSLQAFAAPLEPELAQDVLKLSFTAKKILFPLERCIQFYKHDRLDTFWFDLLTRDAAYLHAVVFMSQAYAFLLSGQNAKVADRRAVIHYAKTLRLLQERISAQDNDQSIADPTILVVLHLATYSHLTNDYATAKNHLKGLRKMVDMRGGLSAFNHNSKFVIEMIKCDLSVAIGNGTEPIFFRDPAIEPLMPYHVTPVAMEDSVLPNITGDLAQAWTTLQRFCSTVNETAEQNLRLDKDILLDTMAPTIYRLLDMSFSGDKALDEAVRVGLLVFSSQVFLQCKDMKVPQRYLPEFCRSCFMKLDSRVHRDIALWLFVIGAISFQNELDQEWIIPPLRRHIRSLGIRSWKALRKRLKGFLWIDFVHDGLGQAAFNSASSR